MYTYAKVDGNRQSEIEDQHSTMFESFLFFCSCKQRAQIGTAEKV